MLKRRLRYKLQLGLALPFYIWIICFCTRSSVGVDYGPSLASLTGVFVNWKGPDIWALESGRKVKLAQYPGFSAVIPLITGDSQATSEQIFQERGISTVGEFMVEAPPSFGLIAVIQELKLRKSTRERGYNSSSCLDYIQFGELRTNGLGRVTEKICGTVHRDDTNVKPPGIIGPRTFMSNGGKIRMAFNHAYVSELVDALLAGSSQRKKPVLRVEVAFTAFKTNCSEEWVNGTADDSAELETFEACSDYNQLVNQTCISSKLLCDDIFNCGGDNDTLGSDDQQTLCPDKPIRTTEKELDEPDEATDRPSGLNGLLNLGTLYGAAANSGSHPPFQYERKFKPYVSPSDSSSIYQQQESSQQQRHPSNRKASGSGNGAGRHSVNANGELHNSNYGSSENVAVHPVPMGGASYTTSDIINESPPKRMDILVPSHGGAIVEDPGYGRRELADAINSVIYGVALFIVFTIFITLFVIFIGRKIQMNLSARNSNNNNNSNSSSRGSMAPVVSAGVTTPSIRPSTTTAVITRDNHHRRTASATCGNGAMQGNRSTMAPTELSFSSSNTTVVLLTLPQHSQSGESTTYDLPPPYETLFPN